MLLSGHISNIFSYNKGLATKDKIHIMKKLEYLMQKILLELTKRAKNLLSRLILIILGWLERTGWVKLIEKLLQSYLNPSHVLWYLENRISVQLRSLPQALISCIQKPCNATLEEALPSIVFWYSIKLLDEMNETLILNSYS